MTPYTKQIVELHKIHKAIENCGCNKDEQGGGDGDSNLTFLENMVKEQAIKPIAYAYYIFSENKYYIVDDTSNFNSIPDIVEFFNNNPTYDKALIALYSTDENFDNNTYYLATYDCAIEAYGSLVRYNNYTTEVTIDGNNYYTLE